jgi:hypothetical protein
MVKRGRLILLVFLLGLLVVLGTSIFVSLMGVAFGAGIVGNSIVDSISTFYEASTVGQRIAILSQFFLFVVVIVVIVYVVKKIRYKPKITRKDFDVVGDGKRSRTDLDTLYEILKKRKEVKLEDVEKAFKVDGEVALGWAKILENGDLAEIDYPRLGKPVLKYYEEPLEENNEGKKEDDSGKKKDGKKEKDKDKHENKTEKTKVKNIKEDKVKASAPEPKKENISDKKKVPKKKKVKAKKKKKVPKKKKDAKKKPEKKSANKIEKGVKEKGGVKVFRWDK